MFEFIVTKKTDSGILLLLGFSPSVGSSKHQHCHPATWNGRAWLRSCWHPILGYPMLISGLLNWTMGWSMANFALSANEPCYFTSFGTWVWMAQRRRRLRSNKLCCVTIQKLSHFCPRRTKSLVIYDGQDVYKVLVHLTNRTHVLRTTRENGQ